MPDGWAKAILVSIEALFLSWILCTILVYLFYITNYSTLWIREKNNSELLGKALDLWALSYGAKTSLLGVDIAWYPLTASLINLIIVYVLLKQLVGFNATSYLFTLISYPLIGWFFLINFNNNADSKAIFLGLFYCALIAVLVSVLQGNQSLVTNLENNLCFRFYLLVPFRLFIILTLLTLIWGAGLFIYLFFANYSTIDFIANTLGVQKGQWFFFWLIWLSYLPNLFSACFIWFYYYIFPHATYLDTLSNSPQYNFPSNLIDSISASPSAIVTLYLTVAVIIISLFLGTMFTIRQNKSSRSDKFTNIWGSLYLVLVMLLICLIFYLIFFGFFFFWSKGIAGAYVISNSVKIAHLLLLVSSFVFLPFSLSVIIFHQVTRKKIKYIAQKFFKIKVSEEN